MEIKKFDILTQIEFEALRLLLAGDPEPEEDATMRQVQTLAILVKEALGDRHYLRHDVLRIITGVPITSQWGLSNWAHHTLISFLKDTTEPDDTKKKSKKKPKKYRVTLRGRRLVDECARIAEAFIDEYPDDMVRFQAEAGVWDMWVASSVLSPGHA